MIGIVLWSDPNECKAVFWCEDHGDLAYYSADFYETNVDQSFAAGDMVQFNVFNDAEFRRAVNPQIVQENAYDGLERSLKSSSEVPANASRLLTAGQVVQFRPKQTAVEPARLRREQR
jgi:hypothetical protein